MNIKYKKIFTYPFIRFSYLYKQQELNDLNKKYETKTNEDTLEVENIICSQFGCGRSLTFREKLFGNKCIKHNGNTKIT